MANRPPSTAFRDEAALSEVMQKVLTRVLGISATTINKHKSIFVPLTGSRGRYNLPESVQNYVAFVRGEDRSGAVQGERGRLYEAQRKKLELQNLETAAELVRHSDASGVVAEFSSAMRAGLTALPGRCASRLAGISKPAQCRAVLNEEVQDLLSSIEQIVTEGLAAFLQASAGNGVSAANSQADAEPDAGSMGGRKQNPTRRKRRAGSVAK